MKRMLCVLLACNLVACGGDGDGSTGLFPPPPTTQDGCSIPEQNQFVLDAMRDWYFWNDVLPATVNIADYSSPEALLEFLTSFQPLDSFSFIGSAAADQQFFGEGRFEGFGFSSLFVATNDLRLTRVFVDSPAFRGGLRRGQQIISLNGRTIADVQANEGLSAVFDQSPVTFGIRESDGNTFSTQLTAAVVTIDPVPQYRIIDAGNGRNVGYLELATFISTANAKLDTAFSEFQAAGVNDVILDLRYNGGGLVNTADLLGDLLGGAQDGLVFSETRYNALRAAANNRTEFFAQRAGSVSLSKLAVIASRGTASASELVTNSMDPYSVGGVGIIGDSTFGKPVGQVGFEFCEKILRPTAFETVNSVGFGDYFDGLPANCVVADDLDIPVGDASDPRLIAALTYLETGGCPVAATPNGISKPTLATPFTPVARDREDPAAILLDAF